MSLKYISDLHFNHYNIIEYEGRNYGSIADMNACMINDWNNHVDTGDVIYVVGDIGLGKRNELEPLIVELKGTKRLVLGNHDRSSNIKHKTYGDILQIMNSYQVVFDGGYSLFLIHDVNHIYNLNIINPKIFDSIDYIICGHVHSEWFIKDVVVNNKEIMAINVSIEHLTYPRNISYIINLAKKRKELLTTTTF